MRTHDSSNHTADVTPAEWLARPFRDFARIEASAGILLLCCTVAALTWANSPKGDLYFAIAKASITVSLGPWSLSEPLLLWINDGLMALFFLVIGCEIKRELIEGELSSWRKAALPAILANQHTELYIDDFHFPVMPVATYGQAARIGGKVRELGWETRDCYGRFGALLFQP
jgi:hypothetical protein